MARLSVGRPRSFLLRLHRDPEVTWFLVRPDGSPFLFHYNGLLLRLKTPFPFFFPPLFSTKTRRPGRNTLGSIAPPSYLGLAASFTRWPFCRDVEEKKDRPVSTALETSGRGWFERSIHQELPTGSWGIILLNLLGRVVPVPRLASTSNLPS